MTIRILYLISLLCVSINAFGRGDWEKFGPMKWMLYSKQLKCNHDKTLDLDVSETNVYFYDLARGDVYNSSIINAAKAILSIPVLEKTRKFVTFVGGFKSNINKNLGFQDTFKGVPFTYLIIVDHSPYTNDNLGNMKSFERAVRYTYYIGKAVGKMLADLAKGGIAPELMHCIGHSLGGHMLGYAGETFIGITGKKIERITALDPAGPCFSNSLIEDQVRSGEAKYVEVYHCNAGGLGSSSVLGDIDFFVNKKGAAQPHCDTPLIPGIFDSSKAAKCNHRSCIDFWLSTVLNPSLFVAFKCDSYKLFKNGMCNENEKTVPGYWSPGNATGVFYFSTADLPIVWIND